MNLQRMNQAALDGEEENVAFPLPKGLWESDLAEARQTRG